MMETNDFAGFRAHPQIFNHCASLKLLLLVRIHGIFIQQFWMILVTNQSKPQNDVPSSRQLSYPTAFNSSVDARMN